MGAKTSALSKQFREGAKKKEGLELDALEKQVVLMIKYHQHACKLKNGEMFSLIDTKKDGRIDEEEFLKFFNICKREPKRKETPPKDTAEGKEDKTDDKEGKDEEADARESEEDTGPSSRDLARVFKYLDEDDEGSLSRDRFLQAIRKFMKVAKETCITSGMSIKESKSLRRLELGEVIEVLAGPAKEETVDVMRVEATVMKDGLEGWITITSNQGTPLLEDGGGLWKVVKETILTEAFELDGSGAKESARKVKDLTRKLKEGELVEVREWAKLEEKSGLTRMKCKTKSDGLIGWVTTVGNQGTVFMEVL